MDDEYKVEYARFGTVCDIEKGTQFNKESMNKIGSYPVINGGITPSGFIEKYNRESNTITISQGGASAGFVNWMNVKFWAGAHCYTVKPSSKVLNRFVYFFLKSQELKLQESQYGAGIPTLSKQDIEMLNIPIPHIKVQEEIVKILDGFYTYSTDLTIGLPAEIEKRKQQYEYYRDTLLNFSNKAAIQESL